MKWSIHLFFMIYIIRKFPIMQINARMHRFS